MSHSPAPLVLDRPKPQLWNVEGAFAPPDWSWFWRDFEVVYGFLEGNGGFTPNLTRDSGAGGVTWDTSIAPWGLTPWGPGPIADNAQNEDSLFTVDSGGSGFWHDPASEVTLIVVCVMTADDGGPTYVIQEGGGTNGLQIFYRTSPDTFHFSTVVENNGVEIDGTSTHTPDPNKLLVLGGRYDNGAMSLWVNGVEEATGSNGTVIGDHTLGVPQLAGGSAEDRWGGPLLAVYRSSRAISDVRMRQIADDPFGMFRPNWDYVTTAAFDPANLQATVDGSDVTLTWDASF